MRRTKTNAGFTLVEMLVVLAIMAITLTISLPYVRGSGDVRMLEATAQVLAARLRATQSTAMFKNAEQTLTIDLKHSRILDPVYLMPEGLTLKVTTAENAITADTASILFFADGGSTGGKIILMKSNSAQELAINWLTGAVVISKVSIP